MTPTKSLRLIVIVQNTTAILDGRKERERERERERDFLLLVF